MARPTKFNKITTNKLIEFISSGLTIKDSCRGCNISEDSFNRWRKKYPDFNRNVVAASDLQWQNAGSLAKYGCRSYKRNHRPITANFSVISPLNPHRLQKPAKINKIIGLPISFAPPNKWAETKPHFNINSGKVEWIDKKLIFHSCSPAKFRENNKHKQDGLPFFVVL